MRRLRLYSVFAFIVLLTLAGVFVALPQGKKMLGLKNPYDYKLGLDLRGGSHLEYEGDLSQIPDSEHASAMNSLRDAIERRIQGRSGGGLGVAEPLIQIVSNNRLLVELPGLSATSEAIKVIGQTPFLEFREPKVDSTSLSDNPEDWAATGLTGKDIERATVEFAQGSNVPQISLKFNGEGAKLFAEITKRNVGRPVGVFLDGVLLQAPTVQAEITGGDAVITGSFAIEEAKAIVSRLNSGALPVPIKLVAQSTVGATLGEASLQKSVLAGLLGLLAIMLFMLIFYRLPGLIASIALLIYGILSLAIFKILPVTMTLAGIAGFLLSIGMAVDANILIFERIKEELRAGKDLSQSVNDGFSRAWLSIRDSNVSTLITTFILGYLGTSIVRGFATTLAIGVLLSMFTAITVTRTLLFLFLARRWKFLNHGWLYGVKTKRAEGKA